MHELNAITPLTPRMVDTLASREEDIGTARSIENIKSNGPFEVTQVVPFSALIPSLRPSFSYFNKDVPQEEEENVANRSDTGTKRRFNEFGFSTPDFVDPPPVPFTESSANRRAWITCLEFSHTHTLGVSSLDEYDSQYAFGDSATIDEEADHLWSRVHPRLVPSPRLTALIRGQAIDVLATTKPGEQLGIPHSLRPHIWPRLTGSLEKSSIAKLRDPPLTYTELVQLSSSDTLAPGFQIEKDLFRTMPNNACFSSSHSTGISRLRRVLRSLAWLYVDVGYCQGMGLIAANLLLCMEEETAFWMMCSIIEDLLPPSYYSSISLLGVQADQAVLCHLLPRYLPEVDCLLKDHGIELSLITLQWFLTLYASVCPTPVTFRIWDLFFYEGSVVLFRIALALLTMKKPELMNLDNPVQIFNLLSGAPGTVTDVNELIQCTIAFAQVAYSLDEEYLDASSVSSLRRHYLAQLMVEESALLQPDSRPNLPKQYLAKRQLKRPRSALSQFLRAVALSSSPSRRLANVAVPFRDPQQQSSECHSPDYSRSSHNGEAEPEDPKLKNVRQTEILVELKQAILMIVRHFRLCDPQHADASSQADYSMESHRLDLETYVQLQPLYDEYAVIAADDDEVEKCGLSLDVAQWSRRKITEGLCFKPNLGIPITLLEAWVAQHRRRRAKALMDFERQEPDELGFSKNDIITIVNSDDEHCWVGELEGVRGWFPANFVELLDERGKNYSSAGDDAVNQNIASLVRGGLCTALSAVFTHGLRRPRLLGESGCHPWHFIEEAAAKEVERDFASVYSRLVLCKTFRLDEEGKVLSPEEVLYRAIHSINMSHDLAQAHMDVKFRSLVCYGLKVLSQFAFHLSPIYELATNRLDTASETNSKTASSRRPTRSMVTVNSLVDAAGAKPLRRLTKAAVAKDPMNDPPSLVSSFLSNTSTQDDSKELERTYRMVAGNTGDMLVKYHLFSWEL
ncbi:hypothetical protein T265_06873 [Opisthorchis viverrini]|uniref:RUN and TBC1 domain-containing protein 3 n=1 Tax=Opisthorchis viverrini TaxID=6198 RepID=A0A075ACY0_OPIVI|nr:hypothetical protein T265_06873 [Opisthorchis viverrini]KER25699.1 hypothetical protein T265_06873 [Opisthorchis viverrini]